MRKAKSILAHCPGFAQAGRGFCFPVEVMMAIEFQTKFSTSEAQAIVEMIAILAADDYQINIYQGKQQDGDFGKYYPYVVEVVETDNTIAATAESPSLLHAINDAYVQTPEGKNR